MGDTRTEAEKFHQHAKSLGEVMENARKDLGEALFIFFIEEARDGFGLVGDKLKETLREEIINLSKEFHSNE